LTLLLHRKDQKNCLNAGTLKFDGLRWWLETRMG
jgi:hypothetical protein